MKGPIPTFTFERSQSLEQVLVSNFAEKLLNWWTEEQEILLRHNHNEDTCHSGCYLSYNNTVEFDGDLRMATVKPNSIVHVRGCSVIVSVQTAPTQQTLPDQQSYMMEHSLVDLLKTKRPQDAATRTFKVRGLSETQQLFETQPDLQVRAALLNKRKAAGRHLRRRHLSQKLTVSFRLIADCRPWWTYAPPDTDPSTNLDSDSSLTDPLSAFTLQEASHE